MVSLLGSTPFDGSIVAHDRDADQTRERRLADLEFVEPRDDAVDRVVDLHDVERDRRRGADGDVVVQRQPPAPGERGGDGQREGDSTVGNQTMRISSVYISE